MDVKIINNIGKGFLEVLRFKTMPVGIKLFEKTNDIPKNFQLIEKKLVTCGVIGLARFYEIPVAITREYTKDICLGADISFGWGNVPPDFAENNIGLFNETKEGTGKLLTNWMSLDGKYEGFGVAPLDSITIEPDVVQFWCNPLQLMELIYANGWHNGGDRIKMNTNGHGGSCYEGLTVPFIKDEITIAIVDMGDRKHGLARDDDMILGVPISKLETLYDGMMKVQKTRHRNPILYDFEDIPFPVPAPVLQRKYPNIY